jgi:uroporphyrinogen decarboxylase
VTPLLVRALRREPLERFPVWMMRQAGRYLPGYRAVRARTPFLDLCGTPALAAEVSLEPMERFDVDGVIVFADILLTADAMGVPVAFPAEGGPRLTDPIRTPADVERIHEPTDERTRCVSETVALLREAVPASKAVIGFSAAPFTLCAYMIQGGSSRDFPLPRQFAHAHPAAFAALMERAADALIPYLREQVEAGADVVQLFDTWGAVATPALSREVVLPAVRRVIEGLGPDRPPVIYFPGIGAGNRLEDALSTGADALSLDWQTDLAAAHAAVGSRACLQGNLDPTVLLTSPAQVRDAARAMLAQVPAGHAHVANLGHGIIKETTPECAQAFVETVREFRQAAAEPA